MADTTYFFHSCPPEVGSYILIILSAELRKTSIRRGIGQQRRMEAKKKAPPKGEARSFDFILTSTAATGAA